MQIAKSVYWPAHKRQKIKEFSIFDFRFSNYDLHFAGTNLQLAIKTRQLLQVKMRGRKTADYPPLADKMGWN